MDDMEDDTSGGMDQVKSNFVQYLVIKFIIIIETVSNMLCIHHVMSTLGRTVK